MVRRAVCLWLATILLAGLFGCRKRRDELRPANVSNRPTADRPAPGQAVTCPPNTRLQTTESGGTRTLFCLDEDDRTTGPVVALWPSGQRAREGTMEAGRWQGGYVERDEHGAITVEGSYKDGLRAGEWKTLRRPGKAGEEVRGTETYVDGKLAGDPRFVSSTGEELTALEAAALLAGRRGARLELSDEGGGKLIEGARKKGLREGAWVSWFDDKGRAAEISYRSGVRQGAFQTWWRDGRPAASGTFSDGKADPVLSRDVASLGDVLDDLAQLPEPLARLSVRCGVLLALTESGTLIAFDAQRGNTLWTRALGATLVGDIVGWHTSDVVPNEGRSVCLLPIQTIDGALALVGALDGKDRARLDVETRVPITVHDQASTILVADGNVLKALDWRTGQEKWSYSAKAEITSTISQNERRLYMGDAAGWLYEVDRGSGVDGRILSQRTGAIFDVHVVDETLYVTEKAGTRYAIRSISGWQGRRDTKKEERDVAFGIGVPTWVSARTYLIDGQAGTTAGLHAQAAELKAESSFHYVPELGGFLVATGKAPAVLRWMTATDARDFAPAQLWALPDVVNCPARLLLAQGGSMDQAPLFLACGGAKRIFTARLPNLDKPSTKAANTLWSVTPEYRSSPVLTKASVHDGVLYTQELAEKSAQPVCARDVYSGRTLYCRPSLSAFQVHGGMLFTSGLLNRLDAFDALTGDPVWTVEPTRELQPHRVASAEGGLGPMMLLPHADGVVVVTYGPSQPWSIVGHDQRSGGVRYRMSASSIRSRGGAGQVQLQAGILSVLSTERVSFIDPRTGLANTSLPLSEPIGMEVEGGVAYVATTSNVAAYRTRTGKRLWSRRVGGRLGIATFWSDRDADGSLVLVAGRTGRYYDLDPQDGTVVREDNGESERPTYEGEPPPYQGSGDGDFGARWVIDGFIGISVGPTALAGVDLRRDPDLSLQRPAPGPVPHWVARRRDGLVDGGMARRGDK